MEFLEKEREIQNTFCILLIFYNILTSKFNKTYFLMVGTFTLMKIKSIYDTGSLRIRYFGGVKNLPYFLMYLYGQQVGNCISFGHTQHFDQRNFIYMYLSAAANNLELPTFLLVKPESSTNKLIPQVLEIFICHFSNLI